MSKCFAQVSYQRRSRAAMSSESSKSLGSIAYLSVPSFHSDHVWPKSGKKRSVRRESPRVDRYCPP